MLFFTAVSLVTTSSSSASLASCPCSTALGVDCLSSLPLLNVIIALTSSILEFGSLESSLHAVPWDLVVSDREISIFPAPVVGWLVLILNTAGCHIFGKF